VKPLAPQLQRDLERHAAFGDKLSGSPGDHATADWIAHRLAEAGYDVQRQPLDVPGFAPVDCSLQVGDAHAELWPQPPVADTEGVTAPLAVVRAPYEAEDARDRIALLVLPHGRHASLQSPPAQGLVEAAAAAGARALVIVPTGPTGGIVGLNCALEPPAPALPIAILAPAEAEPFLRAARSGVRATLRLSGRRFQAHSCNLLASLRRGPRWIVLSTPRTGWFQCASERGTGTAAFLAMAEWAARPGQEHSVFLLNSGAHEYLFAGARQAMPLAPPPADTIAWVHLGAALATCDRLEFRGREQPLPSADPNRTVMASPDMLGPVTRAFAGLGGLERPLPVVRGISELGEIAGHGYRRCFAVLGIPKVFHSRQDDLSMVDGALLAPVVQAHLDALQEALALDRAERDGATA